MFFFFCVPFPVVRGTPLQLSNPMPHVCFITKLTEVAPKIIPIWCQKRTNVFVSVFGIRYVCESSIAGNPSFLLILFHFLIDLIPSPLIIIQCSQNFIIRLCRLENFGRQRWLMVCDDVDRCLGYLFIHANIWETGAKRRRRKRQSSHRVRDEWRGIKMVKIKC